MLLIRYNVAAPDFEAYDKNRWWFTVQRLQILKCPKLWSWASMNWKTGRLAYVKEIEVVCVHGLPYIFVYRLDRSISYSHLSLMYFDDVKVFWFFVVSCSLNSNTLLEVAVDTGNSTMTWIHSLADESGKYFKIFC
jgi:hypothetical protein